MALRTSGGDAMSQHVSLDIWPRATLYCCAFERMVGLGFQLCALLNGSSIERVTGRRVEGAESGASNGPLRRKPRGPIWAHGRLRPSMGL